MLFLDKLRRMQQYAESGVCRRRILLNYFNEPYDHNCNNCDVCKNPPLHIDGTIPAQMLLSAIARTGEEVGMITAIDIVRGQNKGEIISKNYNRLPTFGVGKDISFTTLNGYLLQMLQMGLIDVAYEENKHIKITAMGREVLKGVRKVEFTEVKPYTNKPKPQAVLITPDDVIDKQLLQELKQMRTSIARAEGMPPYIIFSDKTLAAIARSKPTNKAEFSVLYGVGEKKTEKYWREFTDVVRKWLNKQ